MADIRFHPLYLIYLVETRKHRSIALFFFFFKHLKQQSVLETIFTGHSQQSPKDAKTIGHQTCRQQNPWLWAKHGRLNLVIQTCLTPSCLNTSVFCVDLRLEFGGKTITGLSWHHQNNGTQDHRNCISIRPESWWGMEQSVFQDLLSPWTETKENVHHWHSMKENEKTYRNKGALQHHVPFYWDYIDHVHDKKN